ncbi:hypothetical protein IWW43_001485 [Coemansia sp. RSA 1935]|nr:hypothetical protein J3F82_005174 [Coemansia sp. RSA 637]KAJ2535635.1 hypothetical protein IWW43_001485 [Coemansia sp. RSA 1935]
MQAQSSHTLASDFSDELDEPPSHPSHHSQPQQQHHQQHQQQTTSNNDIFGLFDDSNLVSYTLLSPSKMVTPHAANNSQTNVDTAPHASKHSYLTNADNVSHTANYNHSLVDLDHPFDDNPLLHSSPASPMVQTRDQLPPRSPSTNPFSDMVQPPSDTAAVDTNPFRNSHPA